MKSVTLMIIIRIRHTGAYEQARVVEDEILLNK